MLLRVAAVVGLGGLAACMPVALDAAAWALCSHTTGTPYGYRHMNGYSSHTYKWVNAAGEAFYIKMHFKTEAGIRNMTAEEAAGYMASDPDFATRDLCVCSAHTLPLTLTRLPSLCLTPGPSPLGCWARPCQGVTCCCCFCVVGPLGGRHEHIAGGKEAAWRLDVQVMPVKAAASYRYNVLDITKVWSHADFPLIPVGRLVLNRNPENYFAETEQVCAFCVLLGASSLGSDAQLAACRCATCVRCIDFLVCATVRLHPCPPRPGY
jgi:hypothetical protein